MKQVYLKKRAFQQLPPAGCLIIGGSRADHDIPRNGPFAAGFQSLQTFIAVSLAHLLKNAWKIFDERVEVRRLRR